MRAIPYASALRPWLEGKLMLRSFPTWLGPSIRACPTCLRLACPRCRDPINSRGRERPREIRAPATRGALTKPFAFHPSQTASRAHCGQRRGVRNGAGKRHRNAPCSGAYGHPQSGHPGIHASTLSSCRQGWHGARGPTRKANARICGIFLFFCSCKPLWTRLPPLDLHHLLHS